VLRAAADSSVVTAAAARRRIGGPFLVFEIFVIFVFFRALTSVPRPTPANAEDPPESPPAGLLHQFIKQIRSPGG
jgi:hypothetical protein